MKAKTNKTLLKKISKPKALKNAWDRLTKFNKDSHGLSGETIERFSQNLDDKILSISKKLKNNSYLFSQTRGVLISKKNKNSFRPLQIPEISDRIVIKAIAIELEAIFKYILMQSNGYSFAYQKDTGVKDAMLKVEEYYNLGNKYVLEADLVNFFGTVNKNELLEKKIYPNLPDNSINSLINDALNQKIGNLSDFKPEEKVYFNGIENGIPQGNALSPLFSNIYFSDFDQKIIADNYNLIRYADDFVILSNTKRECKEAYQKCKTYLENLNLEIHSLEKNDKTKITDISKDGFTFLSVTFDGKSLYPSIDNFKKLEDKIWELNKGKIELNLFNFLEKIKNKQDGWVSAFIYTDLNRYSARLDNIINRVLYIKLERIDWKLMKSRLDKLPKDYRSRTMSPYCLNQRQRSNSGIPLTSFLISEKIQKIKAKEELNKEKKIA
ncbi:reverse transcriptase domain-containing protein [Chryseobacterium sp. S0630]|uniref:reverse transcriptase domain-containing protein n=1 Tax=Chryseobacterium sp. S0630 TaxID=2957803 RepID=UPI00209DD6AA|nr:reverse transcriptase domain-containing protein [Chryseobacterium sp. S0630]MCP1301200.1 reverse transcriptase domain-containing protein [Chryseobacterium sp. S0630]